MSTIELPQVKNPSGLQPTDIEWADYAFNPLRAIRVKPVLDDQRIAAALKFRIPKGFKGKAGDGRPKVFVCDMTDIFGDWVPFDLIDKLFAVMALRPDVTFQILTKRPERMAEYFRSFSGMYQRACIAFNPYIAWPPDRGRALDIVSGKRAFRAMKDEPLPNVWLGCSIEDQKTADERIPHLLRCSATVRFLSCEPLLGPVDLKLVEHVPYLLHGSYGKSEGIGSRIERRAIHWAIAGGESGANARPCNIAWIRSIMAQCKAAGVPVFVKQIGAVPRVVTDYEASVFPGPPRMLRVDGGYALCLRDRKGGDPSEWPEDLRVRQWPEVTHAD